MIALGCKMRIGTGLILWWWDSYAGCAAYCESDDDCCVVESGGEGGVTYVTMTPTRDGLADLEIALEVYFSRTLGFTLLTLGALTVLLTGSVPLSSSLTEGT